MILNKEGFIEVICGPMFSGKTTELMRRINFLQTSHVKFLVFKPAIDNRYSLKCELVNHNSETFPALLINKSEEILHFISKEQNIKFLIIDEVQFLDNEIEKILNDLSYKGVCIIVAGLDLDFKGRPFGSMPYLLSIADKVIKNKSLCFICGNEASRTQRISTNDNKSSFVEDESIILVGKDNYHKPCCRKCHKFF
ncbi:thymidine kinase [Candidatus Phytoplasma melaleucae]|uniref:Thymidine kinase n=1 Tax=Candidatus Phytoplasma melaleucae TaxID=2982630 RepID=A0ABT9DD58_9MOLU|nr:thymidine kinase ['Melaleuca sp.' phytoplasma]MDO8168013.1 thymidine kinase ['Melaleuca sp.' phytoplasma]MDV3205450.1 thymidine kinase [Weeping tea tree witches'-broom phytoplasma]